MRRYTDSAYLVSIESAYLTASAKSEALPMTQKIPHEEPNIAKLSLVELLGRLTVGQLWAFLGSIIAIIIAAFSLGHYLGNV